MVESDQLTPAGRLGGDTGAFVFNRSDVVALAEKRKAETEEPPTSPTSGASRSVF
ncbi:MAG: hypothetical protein HY829_10570 [Actinobacteria bacterium]|nr:hypothetical protein [Actinomycetota bacterium]